MEKKIYIGNDTAGYYLKQKCTEYLEGKGVPYVDCGSDDNPDIEATRYPFFAAKVAKAVATGEARCGLLICGTGIGVSIVANKVEGVRCALVSDLFSAQATREHNDSNMLAMGGRVISEELMLQIAKVWLETPFSNDERHLRRIAKVTDIDHHR